MPCRTAKHLSSTTTGCPRHPCEPARLPPGSGQRSPAADTFPREVGALLSQQSAIGIGSRGIETTRLVRSPAAATTSGFVLESTQDPKHGVSATLIIKDGTLTQGGFVVAGDAFAPIRFIEDFRGKRIEQAGPSAPVRISGFNKLPAAGSLFSIAANKKEAEASLGHRRLPSAAHSRKASPKLPIIIFIAGTD